MPDGMNTAPPATDPATPPPAAPAGERLPFARLDAAGHPEWWRFVIALLVMGGIYALLFAALSLAVVFLMPSGLDGLRSAGELFGTTRDWSAVSFGDAATTFGALTLPIILVLPAVLLAVVWGHGRPARTLMTARPRFRWGAAASSFLAILVLQAVAHVIGYLFFPDSYRVVLDPARYLSFVPLILLLVPLQVLAEEVFFRGYLVQAVGRVTQFRAVLVGAPALVFAAMHLGNPEVLYGGAWAAIAYVTVAIYLTWLVVRGDGLEHAFGLHLGINLFVFSIVGSPASPYPAPTILYVDKVDYALGYPVLIAMFAAHYWVLFGRRRARIL